MRTVAVVLGVSLLLGCASDRPARRASAPPPPRAAAPAQEAASAAPRFDGPWVPLDQEFELRGYEQVGVRDTDLVVTLAGTRWSEMEFGDSTFREGYAELRIRDGARVETVRVDLDDHRDLEGYRIAVVYVGTLLDETTAREKPHARLVVRELR